jgi:hypothetical protein
MSNLFERLYVGVFICIGVAFSLYMSYETASEVISSTYHVIVYVVQFVAGLLT